MAKTYIRQIKLRRWFPPQDRLAACMARLCFLREDFALEMVGIYAPTIKRLDGNDVAWRKIYFWRQLVRTLGEIRGALRTLQTAPEFRKLYKAQPQRWREWFAGSIRKLENDQALIKKTRNSLGGHVSQETVEQALDNMPGDKLG